MSLSRRVSGPLHLIFAVLGADVGLADLDCTFAWITQLVWTNIKQIRYVQQLLLKDGIPEVVHPKQNRTK